ncbi:glycerate kinase [Shinella sp. BYT-45]|uniref:glycerate kinase n=1 Tax=Shinella sp. BYT-45 TaxID=3377377 RepID=UPI00397F754E
MPFRIVVAPSGFKESLSTEQAADCIEKGVLRAFPGSVVVKTPMADGGEGFTRALVGATNGTIHLLARSARV